MVSKLTGMVTPVLPLRSAAAPTHTPAATAVEFFAGIGLARMGLQAAGFSVVWANDIDDAKRRMYGANFGNEEFLLGDVAAVRADDLPPNVPLAWASFPCTDLSLAGNRQGLHGSGSGTFWQVARILGELGDSRPTVVALENVVGLATSHGGKDIRAAINELNRLGYYVDVLTIDARRFVPQSRPRLFLVGMTVPPEAEDRLVSELRPVWLAPLFEDATLRTVRTPIPAPPPIKTDGLSAVLERVPQTSELWWDQARTLALVDSLSTLQRERLSHLQDARKLSYRTAYRRTRNGVAVWEIRSDDIAGCLRTARGGSSRQGVVAAGQGEVRARWMTPREYARLMGAPDFVLDGVTRNEALFGFGDAVCVPVITWLAANYLLPLVDRSCSATARSSSLALACSG